MDSAGVGVAAVVVQVLVLGRGNERPALLCCGTTVCVVSGAAPIFQEVHMCLLQCDKG